MDIKDKKGLQLSRKQVIYVAAALIVLLCVIIYRIIMSKSTVPTFETPSVTVSKAEMGSVVRYINAIGTLRPNDSVIIKSEVNSMISKIYFTEGAFVREGDLLIELDNTNALASLMEATAQYRKAKSEFEPIEKLANKGVVAKIQSDTRKAELDMCEARVIAYRNALEKHKIYAPFDGVVGLKEVSKGQYVASGQELLKLVSDYPVKVDFKVAEAEVGQIYPGQKVDVLVGGNDNQSFKATVIAIDPESEKISHSFVVRAVLDDKGINYETYQILRPGRFVSVKIAMEGEQRGILVPEGSLEKIGEDDMLYRVSDGIAIRTMVKTGMHRDGLVEIIDGVSEGETVITSGQQNVLDGRAVSIQDGSQSSGIDGQISDYYKEKLSDLKKPAKAAKKMDPMEALKQLEQKILERKKALESIKNPTEDQKKALQSVRSLEKLVNEKKQKLFLNSLKPLNNEKKEEKNKNVDSTTAKENVSEKKDEVKPEKKDETAQIAAKESASEKKDEVKPEKKDETAQIAAKENTSEDKKISVTEKKNEQVADSSEKKESVTTENEKEVVSVSETKKLEEKK